MGRVRWLAALAVMAVGLIGLGQNGFAHQAGPGVSLPGVTVEILGQGAPVSPVAELTLARVTLAPGAVLPAEASPPAAVVSLESGRAGAEVIAGEATLSLAGQARTVPLEHGVEVLLGPGDALSYGDGSALAVENPGTMDATLLYAALLQTGVPFFGFAEAGDTFSFSVETLACPAGMTLLTLDTVACEVVAEPLVAWSIASEQFERGRSSEDATILGATTVWDDLPAGAYFIELTAESLRPGYTDYFIPSSNQVTRQDERTTRIYVDSEQMRGSVRAYVFPQD